MRNSGSPAIDAVRANLGRPPADDPGDGRLHLRPVDAHQQFPPLGVAALAIGLSDAQRVVGGRQLGLRRLHRVSRCSMVETDITPPAELARAVEIVAGELQLGLGLLDHALRLIDRGVGPLIAASFRGQMCVELGAIEPDEHLSCLTLSPSSASTSTIVSPSMRATTRASSRATRVPETNSRSTNSRLTAGTTVTAGGSTSRAARSAAGGRRTGRHILAGAIFAISTGGIAQGAKFARHPDAAKRGDRYDGGDDQGASHREASSSGVARSGDSLPAKSALKRRRSPAASPLRDRNPASIAIRLKRPATKVKKNRAPKRESSRGDATPAAFAASSSFSIPASTSRVDCARDRGNTGDCGRPLPRSRRSGAPSRAVCRGRGGATRDSWPRRYCGRLPSARRMPVRVPPGRPRTGPRRSPLSKENIGRDCRRSWRARQRHAALSPRESRDAQRRARRPQGCVRAARRPPADGPTRSKSPTCRSHENECSFSLEAAKYGGKVAPTRASR